MSNVQNIYFDVTDIVGYAANHSRVSGIQRVQIRLIGSLAHRIGGERIRAVFWHPTRRELVAFDPSKLFDQVEFDSAMFQAKLGLLDTGYFPSRHEIKRYLSPYKDRKIKRGLLKIGAYLTAVFAHDRLKDMDITCHHHLANIQPLELEPISRMDTSDAYVFIGTTWSYPEIQAFGRRHKESGGKVVQMIYDLIAYKAAEYCTESLIKPFAAFLENAPTYASQFACISDWTRKDFIEFLTERHLTLPVSVLPLAHEFDGCTRNETGTQPDSADVASVGGKDFVVCVGTIEIRKNGTNLLRAWAELIRQRQGQVPLLVFAGKVGWKLTEFTSILNADPALQQKVLILPTATDRDLAFLYQRCRFSVYPSVYEGWGLPVGEAAWFGRYVIAANATSLPEVCGDLIDYVDPLDVSDMVSKLGFALDHPDYVRDKEQAIRRAPLRSWDDVADNLLSIIEG